MATPARAHKTRAEICREVTDAQTRANLRSIAIARNTVQAASEARRARVLEQFEAFMALTEHEPTEAEKQRAREVLAESPQARQRRLFQGA